MKKKKGKIRITLISEQDGTSHTFSYRGEWFLKERSVYVRYIESDENDEVRALIRYCEGELSLTRRGTVRSEQLFVKGERRSGHYRSPHASLELEADTTELRVHRQGDGEGLPIPPFMLEWKYDLISGDIKLGRFHNRLYIEEEQGS
ncbi:DUF1934 domain-containing protein [Paenibacillus sp. J5C_2022]|nr:DUF1934 domain-containing protein [Paenibacillus sp. J5C2022]